MGMEIIKKWPTLQDETKNGKIKFWEVWAGQEDERGFTIARSWRGEGGKVQEFPKESSPKNIGKANETTAVEQALKDAESMWKKKKKAGYVEEGEENLGIYPMLAKKFPEVKKKTWPAYISPKLDGVRAVNPLEREFYSRKTTPYELVTFSFERKGHILDGELMLPIPQFTFQDTIKSVTNPENENRESLIYWIYDIVDEELTYEERFKELEKIAKANKDNPNIQLVEAVEVQDEEEFMEKAAEYIAQGYEGAMYRSKEGKYLKKYRSKHLLKYKEFDDDEFEVVGAVGGEGKNKEIATWILKKKNSKGETITFKADSIGNATTRKEYLANIDNYIGKKLTVKYQGFTDEEKPRFGKGIAFRDYE